MKKWSGFLLFLCCWRAYKATNISEHSSQYYSLTRGSCPNNYLRCEFGENVLENITEVNCFNESSLCNGDIDCSDGSDEKYCTNSSRFKYNYGTRGFHFRFVQGSCSADYVMCLAQSKDPKCISKESICNKVPDCSDGSDEKFCPYDADVGFIYQINLTTNYSYECTNSSKLIYNNVSTLCNDERDCDDNIDEKYCPYILSSPESYEYPDSDPIKKISNNTELDPVVNSSLPGPSYAPRIEMVSEAFPESSISNRDHNASSPIIVETTESSVAQAQTTIRRKSSEFLLKFPVNNFPLINEVLMSSTIIGSVENITSPYKQNDDAWMSSTIIGSVENITSSYNQNDDAWMSSTIIGSVENITSSYNQNDDARMSSTIIENVENTTSPSNQEKKPHTPFNDYLWHYLLIFVVIVVAINTILITVIFITLVRFYRYIHSPSQKHRPNHALQDLYIWDDL